MRRKDQEITDKNIINSIIKDSTVCRLGLSENNVPYVVPVCFGYKDGVIYIHGAKEGKKTDILKNNPNVCIEFDIVSEVVRAEKACDWDMKYKSVIILGKASFIDDMNEKKDALNTIMHQYSNNSFEFPEPMVQHINVIKVQITEITGKTSN